MNRNSGLIRPCVSRVGCHSAVRGSRLGITMIEVVIVMGIIGILVALLLPAVQQARGSSRRMQCKNNLRNVALALIAETESKRHFPASGYFGTQGGDFHNWVLTILPWIDQQVIYDQWNFSQPFNTQANFALCSTRVQVLVCPEDRSEDTTGDLSYVVNGGFGWTGPPCGIITPSNYSPIDLNGSGICTQVPNDPKPTDWDMMYQTGLMFCENWPELPTPPRRNSLDTIKDGASNTLMIAENVHAGWEKGHHANWGNPNSWRTCFFLSGHICKDFSCKAGNVDLTKANNRQELPYKFEGLNAPFQAIGAAPWPSSNHVGGLNVALCDGSVRFISENLDARTYFSLVTPQGSLVEGPLAQGPLSGEF